MNDSLILPITEAIGVFRNAKPINMEEGSEINYLEEGGFVNLFWLLDTIKKFYSGNKETLKLILTKLHPVFEDHEQTIEFACLLLQA